MKNLLIVICLTLYSFNLFSEIRTFYLWDDFNQFFSDEGTNFDLTIELGDTLQWVSLGDNPMVDHTITSTNIPVNADSFDYQWNPPANMFFQYVPTELGLHEFECSIQVFVFNMIGSFNVLVNTVGFEELIQSFDNPHPNPFSDRLFFDESLIGEDFIIYDMKGNIIESGVIREELYLSNLIAGVYILQVLFVEQRNYRIVKD
jgi:hypothetical protein